MVGAALLATTPPTPPVPSTTPVPASTIAPVPGSSVPPASAVPGDPLGCEAMVFDPGNELDAEAVTAAATLTAQTLGADLHVRAERNLDGGLDARMAQLDAQCPGWSFEGVRQLDLVVVMYSSTEREASVFYGPEQAYLVEFRWEHALDEMGPRFASGDFTGGVIAGLEALREDPPTAYTPTYDPTRYDDDDDAGSAGVPPVIWLGLAAVVVIAAARVSTFMRRGQWETAGGGDDDSSWRSSRRSSSSSRRSFSSRSSRSSRSSTRRSSRRSGGGTKKW